MQLRSKRRQHAYAQALVTLDIPVSPSPRRTERQSAVGARFAKDTASSIGEHIAERLGCEGWILDGEHLKLGYHPEKNVKFWGQGRYLITLNAKLLPLAFLIQ